MTSTDPARQAERLRTELAATLAAVEDKLNVPRRLRRGLTRLRRDHPAVVVALGVASAAAVAGTVWAVVALRRR